MAPANWASGNLSEGTVINSGEREPVVSVLNGH
jgi:hypothetical protein